MECAPLRSIDPQHPKTGERQKVGGLSCKLLQNQERRWRSSIDARAGSVSLTFFSAFSVQFNLDSMESVA